VQVLQEAYELIQQGQLIQAETSLLGAGSEHVSDPGYWFLLAATRHRLERLDEALENIEQSLALEPTGMQALSARAQILFDMGRRSEALGTYAKALESRPDDPRLLTNMAIVYEAWQSSTKRSNNRRRPSRPIRARSHRHPLSATPV